MAILVALHALGKEEEDESVRQMVEGGKLCGGGAAGQVGQVSDKALSLKER